MKWHTCPSWRKRNSWRCQWKRISNKMKDRQYPTKSKARQELSFHEQQKVRGGRRTASEEGIQFLSLGFMSCMKCDVMRFSRQYALLYLLSSNITDNGRDITKEESLKGRKEERILFLFDCSSFILCFSTDVLHALNELLVNGL